MSRISLSGDRCLVMITSGKDERQGKEEEEEEEDDEDDDETKLSTSITS